MEKFVQLGSGEWVSKEDCEKLIVDFANSVLEDFDEIFPEGVKYGGKLYVQNNWNWKG